MSASGVDLGNTYVACMNKRVLTCWFSLGWRSLTGEWVLWWVGRWLGIRSASALLVSHVFLLLSSFRSINTESMEIYMCSMEASIGNDGPRAVINEQVTRCDIIGRFLNYNRDFPIAQSFVNFLGDSAFFASLSLLSEKYPPLHLHRVSCPFSLRDC